MSRFHALVVAAVLGSLSVSTLDIAVAGTQAAAAGTTAGGVIAGRASSAVCANPARGQMSCLSRVATLNGKRMSVAAPRRPAVAAQTTTACATVGGYGPTDIQSAYNIAAAAATTGSGQTVGVVDAYDNPQAAADLATYRNCWGLPSCTATNGCFTKVDQNGGSAFVPAGQTSSQPGYGWGLEIALDIEAVSSACPNCRILLVEANSASDADIAAAIQRALAMGASQLSLSFGGCEGNPDQAAFDSVFSAAARPITVSSGDAGYLSADNPSQQNPQTSCPTNGAPSYPASSPYVTAVAGTTLVRATATPRGWSETAWGYSGGTGPGSGCSTSEPKPAWQHDTGCAQRTVADVAAVADPNTGLATFDTWNDTGWEVVGGTSLSAPLIAGIQSLGTAAPGSSAAQRWYTGSASINDVVQGTNAPAGAADCAPSAYLCSAAVGYDGPTGVGTPNGPTSPAAVMPFAGLYAVDGYGRIYGGGSAAVAPSSVWPGWDIARGIALNGDGRGGVTLDGWGGLHPFGTSAPGAWTGYWPGWDIAVGIGAAPGTSSGYVLDAWGGLHPYRVGSDPMPAAAQGNAYWPGWSITRAVATFAGNAGGVVLDDFGGIHPFTTAGGQVPAAPIVSAYWGGWYIARSLVLLPGSTATSYAGFVLDGWGGIHPFASMGTALPAVPTGNAYWAGLDVARGIVLVPGSVNEGYVVDVSGVFHGFGGAPQISSAGGGAAVRNAAIA